VSNHKDNNSFALYRQFKAYMLENGINTEEIAGLLGKNVNYVIEAFNGTGGDFSMADVRKICLKYGISSDVIFAQAPKH